MDDNKRLSTQDYWEKSYTETLIPEAPKEVSRKKKLLRSILGDTIYSALRNNYSYSLVWDVIYPRYLPRTPGLKVLEIGSAPGTNLIRMRSVFGYEPFGIEYTANGVRQNRDLFARHDIDPDNVIHADFLSKEVADTYRNHFDVVYSGGFIEHFTDVEDVIRKHVELLKEGGVLIIDIPNLRGVNHLLTRMVNPDILAVHNLSIMDKRVFCSLFEGKSLQRLYCDYYGTFNLQLFFTDNRYFRRIVERGFGTLQLGLNLLLNRILMKRDRRYENRYLSPYLIYIGRKQGLS